MTFGKIIKELRIKAKMTQEELAETLNISGQAVSRWENGLAMPDISILPMLANMFDVTIDYLLGVDITRKQEKIQHILYIATEKGKGGYHDEAVDILRNGLKEYPNSFRLMYGLMLHLRFYSKTVNDNDKKHAMLREAVELGNKILAGCTEDELRNNAIEQLCSCYTALGEQESMKKLAQTAPDIWRSREFLLALNIRGDEQLNAKRNQLCTLLSAAVITLSQLHFRHDTRGVWKEMTSDDIITAQKNALTIADILCPNGDYGTLDFTRIHAFETLAGICFNDGNRNEGLKHLEKAVDLTVYLDTKYDGSKKHTSPLFCGAEYGYFMPNTTETFCESFLNLLKHQGYFEKIIADEKGQALIKRLENCSAKEKKQN